MKMNKSVYIGIGLHRDVKVKEIEMAIFSFLDEFEIKLEEVKGLCTANFIEIEQLKVFSSKFGIPLFLFSRDEINRVEEVQSRSAAKKAFDIKGVAEPCAILEMKKENREMKFIKRKSYNRKITLAVVF